jgi:hypothetical protein
VEFTERTFRPPFFDSLPVLTSVYTCSFDVNPKRRRDEPNFYGYIPDTASARTLVFGSMIMNGALLLLVRSVSTALLSMAGGPWLLVYYGSDMGLYFVYKILRRDFWSWAPLVGPADVVWSVVNRIVVKVLVGHTGAAQFRGSGEMGGCFFSFDMVREASTRLTPYF